LNRCKNRIIGAGERLLLCLGESKPPPFDHVLYDVRDENKDTKRVDYPENILVTEMLLPLEHVHDALTSSVSMLHNLAHFCILELFSSAIAYGMATMRMMT